MRNERNILIPLFLLFFFIHKTIAQDSYKPKYNFRLYNQKGIVMTCDSLTNDKIEIFVKDGRGLEASYSESSYYFTATLSRVFPVSNFHLIWTHLGKKMDIDITLDAFCGQGGHSPNSFWIDKIEFKPGKYTADKNNGLEICCIGYEVHANFTDVNKLKKSDDITDSYYNNYSDRILKINCH